MEEHAKPKQEQAHAKKKRDRQRAHFLKALARELERGHGTKAAQLFLDGQAHAILPTGKSLPQWLAKTLGKEQTGKLVEAFAKAPCFYCKKGLLPCDGCDGRGLFAGGVICETCAGLGVIRCAFCDGSGWVTGDIVPVGLRFLVVAERAIQAHGRIRVLLRKPVPKSIPGNPAESAKRCAFLLLEINRQMGVLENTVMAARNLARMYPGSKRQIAKIVGASCQAAVEARVRIRELLKQMGVCCKLRAEAANRNSAVRKRAMEGYGFYESLAASKTFTNTAFGHPYLQAAIERIGRRHSKTSS